MLVTEDIVMEALKEVQDPELHLSVVELGLVYSVEITNEGKDVAVKMTLTSPACPYGPMLLMNVKDTVERLPGVEKADVYLIWDPPWDPRTMVSDEIKDKLGIW